MNRENKELVQKLRELRNYYDGIGDNALVKLYDDLLEKQTWKGRVSRATPTMVWNPSESWNDPTPAMVWDPRESWNAGVPRKNTLNSDAPEFVPIHANRRCFKCGSIGNMERNCPNKGGKSHKYKKGGRKSHKVHKGHKGHMGHKGHKGHKTRRN
jgi:hypothetical protein